MQSFGFFAHNGLVSFNGTGRFKILSFSVLGDTSTTSFSPFSFSFSSVLQNLLVSLIAAGFVWALLSQFAVYDKTSILVPMLSPYIGAAAASMFTDVSHWILVAGAGILTFVVLTISSKSSLVYFVGIIFVVFGGVVADSYIMRDRHQEFAVKYDNHLNKIAPNAKKYVYFFLLFVFYQHISFFHLLVNY